MPLPSLSSSSVPISSPPISSSYLPPLSSAKDPQYDNTHDNSNNIRVYLRVRPMNQFEKSHSLSSADNCMTFHDDDTTSISINNNSPSHDSGDDIDGSSPPALSSDNNSFSFDRVFDERSSQADVYNTTMASDIPKSLLDGYNCALIGYGPTGTGKTHTMMGDAMDSGLRTRTMTMMSRTKNEQCHDLGKHSSNSNNDNDDPTVTTMEGDVSQLSSRISSDIDDYTVGQSLTDDDEGTLTPQETYNDEEDDNNDDNNNSGMMIRVINDLYRHMRQSPASREFTVRCSYVEIYLERLLDLLSPSSGRKLTVVDNDDNNDDHDAHGNHECRGVGFPYVQNASEACCFDESDVISLLMRGNATRTMTAMTRRMNTVEDGSSRSHAIFTLTLEQKDVVTGMAMTSQLQMVDLAGSNIGITTAAAAASDKKMRRGSTGQSSTFHAQEAAIVTKSFTALNGVITSLMDRQKEQQIMQDAKAHDIVEDERLNIDIPYHASKLTRLLKNAFGGNCRTVLILTASPSPNTISETINTIRFGQQAQCIKNQPCVQKETSVSELKAQLAQIRIVVRALTDECYNDLKQDDFDSSMWKDVGDILKDMEDNDERHSIVEAMVNCENNDKKNKCQNLDESSCTDIERLKRELQQEKKRRNDAETSLTEIQSVLSILQRQNEILTEKETSVDRQLQELRSNVETLSSQNTSLETELHTTQFRSNEAVVFLRQFRKFYRRLLRHNRASPHHGTTGVMFDILTKMDGDVPDLSQLIDIDVVLYEAGLIEEEEMYDDDDSLSVDVTNYTPTADAASLVSLESDEPSVKTTATTATSTTIDTSDHPPNKHQLNFELHQVLKKPQLDNEKANVHHLTTRSGSVSYQRLAQESIELREALEKKTHEMQTLVWKMHELNDINKSYKEKMRRSDEHLTHLENELIDLQNKMKVMVMDKQDAEAKWMEERESFRVLADAVTVPLWQFGECPLAERRLENRIMIPVRRGTTRRLDDDKREMEYKKRLQDVEIKESLIRRIEEKLRLTEEEMKEWEQDIILKENDVLNREDLLDEREDKLNHIESRLEKKITKFKENEESFRRLQLVLSQKHAGQSRHRDTTTRASQRVMEYMEEEKYPGSETDAEKESNEGQGYDISSSDDIVINEEEANTNAKNSDSRQNNKSIMDLEQQQQQTHATDDDRAASNNNLTNDDEQNSETNILSTNINKDTRSYDDKKIKKIGEIEDIRHHWRRKRWMIRCLQFCLFLIEVRMG